MATFFSGQVIGYWSTSTNYMYGTLTGDVTRNGDTVTLSNMSLAITSRYSSYGTSSDSLTVNGTSTSFTVNFGSGSTSAGSYAINSTSFSVAASDTSHTVSWSYSGNGEQTGSGTFVVTFPAGYTAPDTPTISGSNTSATSNTITYGTTSFGNPSTGTVTLYGGTTANPTTVLDTYSATGDHTFTHTGLAPATTYYYRAKANNGQLDSSYSTEISVMTDNAYKLYGSNNGEAKKIIKLYGPLEAYMITPDGTVVTAIDGIKLCAGIKSNTQAESYYKQLVSFKFTYGTAIVRLAGYDSNNVEKISFGTTENILKNNYGITFATGLSTGVNVTIPASYGHVSKEIEKLYGSVGGVAKRIY